jgi:Fe-S cluster assembly ATP-binding protein
MMPEPAELVIQDLHVSVEGKEILKGVNLTVPTGEVHALMGPNGSGKTTLAYTLMGHPSYEVTQGQVLFKGENILDLEPDERARRGIFLAFQYPTSIPGVSMGNFLRLALKSVKGNEIPVLQFRKLVQEKMALLKMEGSFLNRYVNDGFSGGEKKRAEILQMALLEPQIAIMDETDSGLDIDALHVVSEGINAQRGPNLGVLIITHYQRILNYITPDHVHVLVDGRIVRSGGQELVEALEARGYEWIVQEALNLQGV